MVKSVDEVIKRLQYKADNIKAKLEPSYFTECIDYLKEYRDAEEQGLLLRLPCKVGTNVWCIMTGMTGKHPILFSQEFELGMVEHFGKAVFLTKEEAEQKLAEIKGGVE